MSSIWSANQNPGSKDTVKPQKLTLRADVSQKINSLSLNLKQFFGYVATARFDTGRGLDGFTDSSKLMPGVGDYYDVISKMGDPIKKFSDTVIAKKSDPNFKLGNYPKIWQKAKDATAALVALRRMDSDVYRIQNFLKWLPEAEGWPSDYTPKIAKTNLDTALQRDIPVIDFQATIDQNKGQVPDIEDRLKAANAKYLASDKGAPHAKAIYGAEAAMLSCDCKKSFVPTDLKKIK